MAVPVFIHSPPYFNPAERQAEEKRAGNRKPGNDGARHIHRLDWAQMVRAVIKPSEALKLPAKAGRERERERADTYRSLLVYVLTACLPARPRRDAPTDRVNNLKQLPLLLLLLLLFFSSSLPAEAQDLLPSQGARPDRLLIFPKGDFVFSARCSFYRPKYFAGILFDKGGGFEIPKKSLLLSCVTVTVCEVY